MARDYRFTFQLFPDPRTSDAISEIINDFRERGLVNEEFTPVGYQPHVTLAAFATLNRSYALDTAAGIAAAHSQLELSIAGAGQFVGETNALYLSPARSPALQSIFSDLHARYAKRPEQVWHLYSPPEWVPHIGLVIDTDPTPVDQAASLLDAIPFPAGRLDRIALTGFGPAIEFPLRPVAV